MKKILIRVIIVVVLLVIIGIVAVGLSLDRIVKTAIEKVGSKLTGVEVKTESVGVSVLSGNGSVKGFVVGNPSGFKSPWAIKVDKASMGLQPSSVFADKVIIKSIKVEGPEIALEFNMDPRANNLSTILANVKGVQSTGQASAPAQAPSTQETKSASKKIQVDEFVITGARFHLSSPLLNKELVTPPIPDIRLMDLGKGPEGITGAELAEKVLEALKEPAARAALSSMSDLGNVSIKVPDLKQAGTNALDKAAKGLGNLLNR